MGFTPQVDARLLSLTEAEWVSMGLTPQMNVRALLVDVDGVPVSVGGASALDDLTDVAITSATAGQLLNYSGSAWVNGARSLVAATGNEKAYTLAYTVNKATSGNDTGLLISMTDTNSPGTSLPLDVQVGGTSVFNVTPLGRVTAELIGSPNAANLYGLHFNAGSAFDYYVAGSAVARLSAGFFGITGGYFGLGTAVSSEDVKLYRDAAAILALRNSTTAQTFRVYGTAGAVPANDYVYAYMTSNGTSSVTFGAATGGTGADNIDVVLSPAGTGEVTTYTSNDGAGNWRRTTLGVNAYFGAGTQGVHVEGLGTGANPSLALSTKGTGGVFFAPNGSGMAAFQASQTGYGAGLWLIATTPSVEGGIALSQPLNGASVPISGLALRGSWTQFPAIFRDTLSAAASTTAHRYIFGQPNAPSLTATNATTYTIASTWYVAGAPTASTNVTIGTAYTLYVAAGDTFLGGTVKASGYKSSDGTAGATAGPFTVITSITVKDGLVTALTGS